MVTPTVVNESYALYQGDCMDVLRAMPTASIHLSVYSPPFGGLYVYSSSPRDLSNCLSTEEFFVHYAYIVAEIARVTLPGRVSAVHCMDIPLSNTGDDALMDFPGQIIHLHQRHGMQYIGRHHVWKEPLAVRNRTMAKNLAHKTIVEDSALCSMASADYLLLFRKAGHNPIPVAHPQGLTSYAGAREVPAEIRGWRGYAGNQIENKYSQWVWRQYASAFWDDVRLDRVVPFEAGRDPEDERHIHPLQLDVIERVITLRSNPGEVVLTPFMGVGSEIYMAVLLGRQGLGVELKRSYFLQAVRNIESAQATPEQPALFATLA